MIGWLVGLWPSHGFVIGHGMWHLLVALQVPGRLTAQRQIDSAMRPSDSETCPTFGSELVGQDGLA